MKGTPRGKVRVQIPGYAWLDALREPFVRDNEGWFEQRVSNHRRHGQVSSYVAILDPDPARLLGSALEHRAAVTFGNVGWALRRAALRIEADLKVMEA